MTKLIQQDVYNIISFSKNYQCNYNHNITLNTVLLI